MRRAVKHVHFIRLWCIVVCTQYVDLLMPLAAGQDSEAKGPQAFAQMHILDHPCCGR